MSTKNYYRGNNSRAVNCESHFTFFISNSRIVQIILHKTTHKFSLFQDQLCMFFLDLITKTREAKNTISWNASSEFKSQTKYKKTKNKTKNENVIKLFVMFNIRGE